MPLGDEWERLLFAKFAEVTRATVKGNLVVAVVQGTLGGVIFWFLGIPGPLLWVVMTLLSLNRSRPQEPEGGFPVRTRGLRPPERLLDGPPDRRSDGVL